ncbi:MAG: hypothetical protein KDD45_17755, partial [Bdellovibrionales bacterium]|nr:hypothetical protein [Bdellovibrionales bacterium]
VSFGSVNINQSRTKEFRKAVRYYAENLCGYTHLEYDFKNNVSEGLTMALKFYIRLVMMSPLHISRQVLRATNHESGKI